MKLRVFADRTHYSSAHRKALTDILKAAWNQATLEERRKTYGAWIDLFEVVSSPTEADIHLLPMKWPYYVEHDCIDLARRAVDAARRARKPIAVFSTGDFEANFPEAGADIHLFQAAGYRSRQRTRNHGIPAFFDDPLIGLDVGDGLRRREARARVGFCGQAGASLPRHAARLVRNRARRILWRLGREKWEPPPFEHTWFRQRVLDAFASCPRIDTHFILRTRYRAGVRSADRNDPAEKSRREFLQNVLDTDYTVCMRGGGNFSVRFYEALAMRRIPAFVDTDCVLPYAEQVNWKQYTVWIDQTEISRAGHIVADFHANLSARELEELQQACRAVWLERLTVNGFYTHFHEHFPELAA